MHRTPRIGGWMLAFLVLNVISLALNLILLALNAAALWGNVPAFPGWLDLANGLVHALGGCFFVVLLFICLNRRKPDGAESVRLILFFMLALDVLHMIVAFVCAGYRDAASSSYIGLVSNGFGDILRFVIWYLYFEHSRRVKEYFQPPTDDRQEQE